MSSSQDLPVMGEHGLNALRKDLTEDVLRSRKEGCWVPADREAAFLFSGATCGRSTCDIDLSL